MNFTERFVNYFFPKKVSNEDLILKRIKEYFENEPYCEVGIWSWSEGLAVDLVFPELIFEHKQTKKKILFGMAFHIVNPNNTQEIEKFRDLFQNAGIPSVLLNTNVVPSSTDLKSEIEKVFAHEYKLLSIK